MNWNCPSLKCVNVPGGNTGVRSWLVGWVVIDARVKFVSTNQLDRSLRPPLTKPCARKIPFVGQSSPLNCHPPAMCVPSPSATQFVPLVEASNVVRQTSGLLPPRCQLMAEPSKARFCVTGSVGVNRPR